MHTQASHNNYWNHLPLNKVQPQMHYLGVGGKLQGKRGVVCYTTEYKMTINMMNENGAINKRKISVNHSKFKFWTNRKIEPPIDLPIPSRIATPINTNHITDSDQTYVMLNLNGQFL